MEGWTREEETQFAEFLNRVVQNGGSWPDLVWPVVQKAIPLWAAELVAVRGGKVLLTRYAGGETAFRGLWHIPGGYAKIGDAGIEAVCQRVAMRELSISVEVLRVLDTYFWKPGEHPTGRPLSVYVLVQTTSGIIETDRARFFSPYSLPKDMVPVHRAWLKRGLF